MESKTGAFISIDVVKGGYILTYPEVLNGEPGLPCREVFVSPRKLNQKIKEIIDDLGLSKDEK